VCCSERSYVNVSAHWLDSEFTTHHKCLAVKRVLRNDPAEFITSQLNSVINEWSLDVSSLCVVVSDDDRIKQAVSQVGINSNNNDINSINNISIKNSLCGFQW